ncbi:MAG: UDP-glucose/GDP-mannose dehydrogenase family protein [Phycisphaerae bacterium]|nr:UDP-glucose/GDP-mannose dehydrogenase family protein [Phycisphaerae bacterium]
MRITMVGTGYVGLVTGTCFANTGNEVTCLDIDQQKIDKLNAGISPIYEPGLDQMISRNVKAGRLHFTTDRKQAYESAEAIFICVGTPPDETGHADLRFVFDVARDVGQAIEAAPGPCGGAVAEDDQAKIVIIKSTVPVGTNARAEREIGKQTSKPFHMASNPEFMKEGEAIHDFVHPDRVVLGVADRTVGHKLRDLYEPFVRQGNPIFIMDIASAEMVKYASNTMLATKISFINEIANLCEAYNADIDEVRRGMCSDSRIGRSFLFPGLGYGGSCFPKDVKACISMGERAATPASLLTAVHQVNQTQRFVFIKKILDHFGGAIADKRFAFWGIAFKPGTDDIREAPAMTLMKYLLENGAQVAAFDEVAAENCRHELGRQITLSDDMMCTLDGAHALIICTNWGEFLHPDFEEIHRRMAEPVIFDGRNLYRPDVMTEHGFAYYSVGRRPQGATERSGAASP